ncbi:MAG: UDP-N-acetylmuramate dehydrogenase [Clostridia bacterium]|nr:UDP-N-acetylmuramate dehydrogenase [Clostridia bacterium]
MTFFDLIRAEFPALKLMNEEPMAAHTSFRIGGPATIAFPSSCEELTELYRFCLRQGIRPLLLGAGTNVLAPDAGLDRLVICTKELSRISDLGDGIIEAECGVSLARLACFARDLSLTGLEFAHGIPGTVGGGVYMNAGAYGGEMCQVVVRTTALLPDGTLWEVEGLNHEFGYRHSAFEARQAVVLRSAFQLTCGDADVITAKMQELIQKRRNSQPLELPSAGSTFKRPAGGFAAALIDQAGLKGKGVGGAAVSEKHAGFVVNLGDATAADVLATMKMIQQTVQQRSGILLEPEVRIW